MYFLSPLSLSLSLSFFLSPSLSLSPSLYTVLLCFKICMASFPNKPILLQKNQQEAPRRRSQRLLEQRKSSSPAEFKIELDISTCSMDSVAEAK